MLSAAAVELLRGHSLLADHAVSLGYVERLLKLLSARLPPTPQGKPPALVKHRRLKHLNGLASSVYAQVCHVLEYQAMLGIQTLLHVLNAWRVCSHKMMS